MKARSTRRRGLTLERIRSYAWPILASTSLRTWLVFAHWHKGTPVDPSKVSGYMRKALAKAGITKSVRAFHDLRHSSLTHAAAAGNPAIYVQHRAGHSQGSVTERYLHAAQVLFPGAAEKAEARLFAETPELGGVAKGVASHPGGELERSEKPHVSRAFRGSGGRI